MATTQTQELIEPTKQEVSPSASIGLIKLGGIMLLIAVIWRIIDQFVLGLGDTWVNIFPSKLFPFLIILIIFLKYRPTEIESVLGLSRDRIQSQFVVGLLIGIIFAVGIDFGGSIVYALFLDSTYPLELHILNQELLGYTFLFFLTNAFLEETLFRGLLLNAFKTRMAPIASIVLSATIFGFWHAGWPIINGGTDVLGQVASMVFFTMLLGMFFGIYYERFSSASSLIGPITIHTIINFSSENFKIGPEPVIQGPDLAFSNGELMITTLLMFFLIFVPLGLFLWKYKIEQVTDRWQKLIGHVNIAETEDGISVNRMNNEV
ncbi:MAG: CPBP family intramembrane metalloprotease [Candidatus Thorarchaeota archaeon]|nr:CPBP family intramembrane metalloprotease [Candidatus Thorarchaeota archaeon]